MATMFDLTLHFPRSCVVLSNGHFSVDEGHPSRTSALGAEKPLLTQHENSVSTFLEIASDRFISRAGALDSSQEENDPLDPLQVLCRRDGLTQ